MSPLVEQEKERTREDYENLTVTQLKDILREQGRPLSGRKEELINRIMTFTNDDAEECELSEEVECDESDSDEE